MRTAAISGRYRATAVTPLPNPTTGVQLLIHGNGFPGYNQVIDDALGASVSNNSVVTSATVGKYFPTSLFFSRHAGAYLTVSNADNRFQLGNSDFDIGFWYYPLEIPSSGNYQGLLGLRQSGSSMAWSILASGDTNRVTMELKTSTGGSLYLTSGTPMNLLDWNFIRVVRQGSTFGVSVNGVFGPLTTSTATIATFATNLTIGILSSTISAYYAAGYMQDIRIIIGNCFGTTDFLPPTAPLKGNPRPEVAPFYTALRSYWTLDDTTPTNNFLDSIGTNHLKTLDGTSASGLVTNAKVAKGTHISNMDGLALYGPTATTDLTMPNADFSFGGWMTFASPGSQTMFLMGRIGAMPGTQIQAYIMYSPDGGGGNLIASASVDGTSAGQVQTAGLSTSPGDFHLIVLTFNRTANQLELRARAPGGALLKAVIPFPGALFTGVTTANFTISGAASNDSMTWSGRSGVKIGDESFFADTAVTDAQFDYLFNNGVGRQLTSIQIDAT